jgi:gliding motility-associated-like protein
MYYMTARAGFGASVCSVTDSIMVFVEPNLTVRATASKDTICAGESVTLTAEGGLGNPQIGWSPLYQLSSPTGAVVQAQPFESTTYIVELEEANCRVYDSVRVVVLPQAVAAFNFLADTGCGAQTVHFFDASTLAVTRIWNFGDGSPVVNTPNPVHTYTSPGTYTVTLLVNNAEGCASLAPAQQTITVSPLGSADYTTSPLPTQVLVLPDAHIQFIPQNNAVRHLWLFGDGTSTHEAMPTHTYRLPGHYNVQYIATDAAGCVYTNTDRVVVVRAPEANIPNVFTPNGDGVNDVWHPRAFGFTRVTVKVLDRWGNEVYSAQDLNQGWKGALPNGNEAPEGVYFYYLKLDDRELRGSFTLLR